MTITAMIRCIAILTLSAASGAALASTASDLRATMFKEANDALARANDARASIFAPMSYSRAAAEYRDAEEELEDAGSLEDISEALKKAVRLFNKSAEAAEVAKVTLPAAIAARADSENAEAERFAPEAWKAAEVEFANAVRSLENDSLKSAQRTGEEARALYREAELLAIKANYLDETRTLLEQARDVRAKRYAPTTLARAEELLTTAEQALETDRYDTDRPRALAQEAKYEARHAIYLSEVGDQVRRKKISLEDSHLAWENAIRGVADKLDSPIDFASGPQTAAEALIGLVGGVQSELAQTQQMVRDQEQYIAALKGEMASLEEKLGGESESLQMANALLAAQERIRARMLQVEQLFTEEQAIVLRKGNDVIIRMVGLNFESGKAIILPQHHALLETLRKAFNLFPRSAILIEGHTDSFGSDEFNNKLSKDRARAVEQYLLDVAGFDPTRLSSIGHGESRPAANNETAEGRKHNRRIDVVIFEAGSLDG